MEKDDTIENDPRWDDTNVSVATIQDAFNVYLTEATDTWPVAPI